MTATGPLACDACGQTLRRLQLPSGAWQMVNPRPDETGTIAARLLPGPYGSKRYGDAYTVSRAMPRRPGFVLFRVHRADCGRAPLTPAPAPAPGMPPEPTLLDLEEA